ncbi:MAG: adenine deaminase [Armatimonadota bacterium]|nr:adenine deaminase [Armatimonadota bacterium]
MFELSNVQEKARLIAVARGREKADAVIRGGRVVNVFTEEVYPADIALCGDRIAGIGSYESDEVIDASGLTLIPGLIDGHIHIESSLLTPAEFARAALPFGTTSVVIDPHEIANVVGAQGVRQMLAASAVQPVTFYVMIPSCVPASEFETSGGAITAADIASLALDPRALGLAEVMNYPGVLEADPETLLKISINPKKVTDGHAPGLTGRDLNAYVAAGMGSDHETVTVEEAVEKLRAGMRLMIREGSVAKNLDTFLPLVNRGNLDRLIFVTDDLLPSDILEKGHLDHLLRRAVAYGIDPIWAVKMATINPASYFDIRDIGALAPGFKADIVAVENLRDFKTRFVIHNGEMVYREGRILARKSMRRAFANDLFHTVRIAPLRLEDIRIPAKHGLCRVIEALPGRIVTDELLVNPATLLGWVVSDVHRDILKIVSVERHNATGRFAVGLITGFGLERGAIASSVAHDAHNIVAVGADDEDILTAINEVVKMQGGLVVSANGSVLESLPLPVAGLLSTQSARTVVAKLRKLEQAAAGLGVKIERPFMALSFMSLSVVPKLKLTDRGLVDVEAGEIVDLFEDATGWAASAAAR